MKARFNLLTLGIVLLIAVVLTHVKNVTATNHNAEEAIPLFVLTAVLILMGVASVFLPSRKGKLERRT